MRPPNASGEPAGVQLTHAAARDLDALPTSAREQMLADIQSRLDDGGVTVMRVIDRKDLTRSLRRLRGAS